MDYQPLDLIVNLMIMLTKANKPTVIDTVSLRLLTIILVSMLIYNIILKIEIIN
jgi:hypothetical protein